jgi:hypothetical protein
MPKTISDTLLAHMQSEVTTVCTCWQITRQDGVAFYFTDHDQDIVFEGNTYRASVGYTRSAVSANSDMSTDNVELRGMFDDDTITNEDLQSGLFDFAEALIFMVNWNDLTMGAMKLRRASLGDVQGTPSGIFITTLNGLVSVLNHNVGDLYQSTCRSDLGDSKCQVPIAPPDWTANTAYGNDSTQLANYARPLTFISIPLTSYFVQSLDTFVCTTSGTSGATEPAWNTTVGSTTSDGSAVWTAISPWRRLATVATLTDQMNFKITVTEPRDVDGWFSLGTVKFLTGNNIGRAIEIKKWVQATGIVTLYLPCPLPIQIGDTLLIHPGCDKSLQGNNGCKAKFNNVINRQAEDYVPGSAFMTRGPASLQ